MRDQFHHLFLTHGVNYCRDDRPFQEMLKFLGMAPREHHDLLGAFVGEEMMEVADSIDHGARPVLHTWGLLGERIDFVRISPEHRRVLGHLRELRTISAGLEDAPRLWSHFLSGYLISDAGLFCTITLTMQTAFAVWKYGDPSTKERFLSSLATDSPHGAWGATFYTEVQGGSDLGANVTVARETPEGWRLWGPNKYFTSNVGLADVALVTAKPEPVRPGPKGIALFLVPGLRASGEPNFSLRRLKDKMGTRAVPTGEVELEESEAFLLGEASHGIYTALEILNIARVDNALAAVGLARKALWEAYRYAVHRQAFGKALRDHPLLRRDLWEMEAEVEVGLLLALCTARAVSATAEDRPPYSEGYFQARLLTHLTKALTSWMSQEVTRSCLEVLGGIGFLEEFPLARLHREALVTSIWEGTSNIQALEFLDLWNRAPVREAFWKEVLRRIQSLPVTGPTADRLRSETEELSTWGRGILEDRHRGEFYAKDLLTRVGHLMASLFFLEYAHGPGGSDGARALLDLYVARHIAHRAPDVPDPRMEGALEWMA